LQSNVTHNVTPKVVQGKPSFRSIIFFLSNSRSTDPIEPEYDAAKVTVKSIAPELTRNSFLRVHAPNAAINYNQGY
jgi:hypothetical protein